MPEQLIPEATSGRAPAADSLDAAASAFRGILSRKGTPESSEKPPAEKVRVPGLKKPVGEETPELETEAEEPVVEEVEETQPETEETEAPESEVEEQPEVEDGEQENADQEETEEPETPPTVRSRKIKLPDGTEKEVTEDEAYNGYLRTEDYTRKTQAAAEVRKAADAEAKVAREQRALYSAQLEQVVKAMDSIVPKEPNWQQLRATVTPEEFAATWADYQQFSQRRNAVIAEQNRVAEETATDFKKQMGDYREQEVSKLLAVVPAWRDEKTAQTELASIAAYARSIGYTQEEIDNVVDSRVILSWRRSMQWDKLQAAKPAVQKTLAGKPKIKTAPPGSPSGKEKPAPVSEENKARKALRSSGSLDDAANVFQHVLTRRAPAQR